MGEGKKHDDNKLRYDLISPQALTGLVEVLTFGANKYTPRNWSNGILYGRVFAAIMRHLWAWWNSSELDEETNLSHLDHAACGLHFLSHYIKNTDKYNKYDDRPNKKVGCRNHLIYNRELCVESCIFQPNCEYKMGYKCE